MKSKRVQVIIVGGVAAGPKTAARLRRLNPDADITLIERWKVLSYAGCGMPYFVGGDVPEWKKLTDTPAGVVRDGVFSKCQRNQSPGPDPGPIHRPEE
jgi:NADPH-dependent 2,4-dienoyl-CoA reductase/sulfur reductase-like enzyme